jgi:hypothetical protein
MISVIVPYRDRPRHLPGCLRTLAEHVGEEYEVLISEQADGGHFLRGQLANLAFGRAAGQIVVIMDVDARFMVRQEFSQWSAEQGKPLLPWARVVDVAEDAAGRLTPLGAPITWGPNAPGMCNVLTRKQFEASNGFSNLTIGWGAEDNVFDFRVGRFARLDITIAHVAHRADRDKVLRSERRASNMMLCLTDRRRNAAADSVRQTLATELPAEVLSQSPRIVKYAWRDITVPADFSYRELLDDYHAGQAETID